MGLLLSFTQQEEDKKHIYNLSNLELVQLIPKFIDSTQCYVTEEERKYVIVTYHRRIDSISLYQFSISYFNRSFLYTMASGAIRSPDILCNPIAGKKIILLDFDFRKFVSHDKKELIELFKDDYPKDYKLITEIWEKEEQAKKTGDYVMCPGPTTGPILSLEATFSLTGKLIHHELRIDSYLKPIRSL